MTPLRTEILPAQFSAWLKQSGDYTSLRLFFAKIGVNERNRDFRQ
jgi:hypothetical protein